MILKNGDQFLVIAGDICRGRKM